MPLPLDCGAAGFGILKQRVLDAEAGRQPQPQAASHSQPPGDAAAGGGGSDGETVRKLRLQLQQRDTEIAMLVSMVKARPGQAQADPSVLSALTGMSVGGGGSSPGGDPASSRTTPAQLGTAPAAGASAGARGGEASSSGAGDMAALMDAGLLADRNKAFELFRKSYRHNEVGGRAW
jgi:kinesin family protein 6/9